MDCTFSWFRGLASFPLLPAVQEEEDEEDEGLPESMRETAKEKEERKTDHDVARQDVVKVHKQNSFLHFTCFLGSFRFRMNCKSAVIKKFCRWRLNDYCWPLSFPCRVFQGLLKMKLLPRLRYILEVVRPSPRVVQDVLEILTRIARHSSSSATKVVAITATTPVT